MDDRIQSVRDDATGETGVALDATPLARRRVTSAGISNPRRQVHRSESIGSPMIDPFARKITYLRLSVTDRCDFRCVYCMAEDMTFLPKAEVLSIEELDRLCSAFIRRGVIKLRLTGGEPLVRRGVMDLVNSLGRHLATGALRELTLTTNGSQLARHAEALYAAGVRRVNVSVDTLDAGRFAAITRRGRLAQVMEGLAAAKEAGLAVKINTVVLRGLNDDEYDHLIRWCGTQGFDLTLIETMPLGEIAENRTDRYLPVSEVGADLARRWTLVESDYRSGGPARYFTVAETGRRLGFITPMSHNFCADCNRVRLTSTGQLYMCLGHEDHVDLREPLRASESNIPLNAAIDAALAGKPEGHAFVIGPGLARHMSTTGG